MIQIGQTFLSSAKVNRRTFYYMLPLRFQLYRKRLPGQTCILLLELYSYTYTYHNQHSNPHPSWQLLMHLSLSVMIKPVRTSC